MKVDPTESSNAPISTAVPTIRGKPAPRWSVVSGLPFASTAKALLPRLTAGLVASRAMVCVGPPLLASAVARPGLATATWLPLLLVRPPEPPVPIRLYALLADTSPRCRLPSCPCRCRRC